MELDLKNELEGIKEVSKLRGKLEAMQEIKQRFMPVFMLPEGTISKVSFDIIMDGYHDGLTREMKNIEAKQEILNEK